MALLFLIHTSGSTKGIYNSGALRPIRGFDCISIPEIRRGSSDRLSGMVGIVSASSQIGAFTVPSYGLNSSLRRPS